MDGFKQRIIGALVLICLAVIFVPMLFEKPHDKSSTQTIQIPSEPQSQSITIEKPKQPGMGESDKATSSPMSGMNTAPATSASQSGTAEQSSGNGGQQALQQEPAQTSATSASPSTPTESQAAPEAPAAKPAAPEKQAAPEPAQAAQQKAAPKAPAKPEGKWVVQLGSFGEAKNADRLRQKVRAKGYAAYLEKAQAGGKTLTRVFAGPFAEKSDAVSAKQALDRDFGIKSLVMTNEQHK